MKMYYNVNTNGHVLEGYLFFNKILICKELVKTSNESFI
jgi:hypothetical protein